MRSGCCLAQLPVIGFLAFIALLLGAAGLVDTLGIGPAGHPRRAASPAGRR
jgi:hypothetical protein